MEIIVKGSPQEVAAFVVELQERADVMMDELEQALEAVGDAFDEPEEESMDIANEQAFLMAAERIKASLSDEDIKYLQESAVRQLIDVSANPKSIEAEKLTEREMYCISRHTKYLAYTLYQARQSIAVPCYSCLFNQECSLDFMETFRKLGEITGEKIHLCTNARQPAKNCVSENGGEDL